MDKKFKIGLTILIAGFTMAIVGLIFLLVNILAEPGFRDAEYLVKIGSWQEKGADSVIWQFTEIGKGTLTTDNHKNDYDFIWAIDGNRLKIETDWFYALNDEFEYNLDQNENILTLNNNILFVPTEE